jgi:hypothetical protein
MDILQQDPTMTPAKLKHDQDMAMLSNASYLKDINDPTKGFRDTIPDNYERVTKFDTKELQGFSQKDFENSKTGFQADLYRNKQTGTYVLAFRGTEDKMDWVYGNTQAFDSNAPQYKQAMDLATNLHAALGNKLTDITGHSLGGGLAAASSMITDIPATTFNAAGLNPKTITSRGYTLDQSRVNSLITNYHVQDELLTSLQVNGSVGDIPLAVVPGIGPLAELAGIASPNSAGRQITIEAFNPQGQEMNWFERNNIFKKAPTPLELHGMDYVMRGMLINK